MFALDSPSGGRRKQGRGAERKEEVGIKIQKNSRRGEKSETFCEYLGSKKSRAWIQKSESDILTFSWEV